MKIVVTVARSIGRCDERSSSGRDGGEHQGRFLLEPTSGSTRGLWLACWWAIITMVSGRFERPLGNPRFGGLILTAVWFVLSTKYCIL